MWDYPSGNWLPLRPDGYFELWWAGDEVMACFVELDMGTETNERFVGKMRAYDIYRRGEFKRDYELSHFVVLVVTTGAKRAANLRRAMGKTGNSDYYLFATLESLHPNRVLTGWQDADGDGVDLRTF